MTNKKFLLNDNIVLSSFEDGTHVCDVNPEGKVLQLSGDVSLLVKLLKDEQTIEELVLKLSEQSESFKQNNSKKATVSEALNFLLDRHIIRVTTAE
ncbi:MAG: hypothetical protein CME64_00675 [Halobacteriovoraceae bacterium]|nr:hypothetical protein [Halobacteriovoraceae bacterium]|tara:strand:+ start:154070 stop:154357 length:288 start_codon:yes stop_codon:yes gene_type:complete